MSIVDAIETRHLLTFNYDGYMRTVEPHTFGIDRKGHLALRAYQVSGGSESGEYVGWKMFHGAGIHGLTMLAQTFPGPRPKYKRGDIAFASIRAQL